MLSVVSVVLHTFPSTELDVSTTVPPSQNVVGPDALIVATATGCGFTTTVNEEADKQPSLF